MPRQASLDLEDRSRAELLAEVRRLQSRVQRQDLALGHAAEAIVTLRRGVEALRAHNRELVLQQGARRGGPVPG
jgi:hypothetical protein